MNEEQFNTLVDEIAMVLGSSDDRAAEYAQMIGDNPVRDKAGFILAMKNGRPFARFRLKFFGDKKSMATWST